MDVIYLDSLFGLNLLIDYCLVLASARVCGVVLRRWRYALAALIGALYAALKDNISVNFVQLLLHQHTFPLQYIQTLHC